MNRVNRVVTIEDAERHMSPAAEAVLRAHEDWRVFQHQLDTALSWCRERGLVLVTVDEAKALQSSRVPPGDSVCEAKDRENSPDLKGPRG